MNSRIKPFKCNIYSTNEHEKLHFTLVKFFNMHYYKNIIDVSIGIPHIFV